MEVMDEAGDVERRASAVVSTEVVVVSTIDVGRDRVVGNASLGVLMEGGLGVEDLASPDIVAISYKMGSDRGVLDVQNGGWWSRRSLTTNKGK